MKNDEKTTIGKSRPSTWVKKCQKMSKGLKIDVAWWNQIWNQVFAWTHGNAMKRNSRNSLHPKRLNRLIPLACVSRKAPWSIQSIQFCCPRRSAHKNASNKKKYHELLFNINNCLPVLHTTWDRRRSWQAFHSTHYSWRYFVIIWCMIYVCL